jgi:lipopolysaccharide transport system permease protein
MSSPAASTTEPVAPPREAGEVPLPLHRPSLWEMAADTWRQRRLIPRVGVRITVKGFAGTKLGRAWLVLRPVITIFGMALLFGAVLDTPSQGLPYLVFLLVGMHAWMAFERTAFWAVRSFDSYRRVARRFHFPLLVVPTAAFIPAGIEWVVLGLIALTTLLVFSFADGTLYLEIAPALILAPIGYVLASVVGYVVGGLWLAPLNALARDVRIVFRFVLQPWLFVTPVVYPSDQLPSNLQFLATINPVAAPVEMVRYGVFGVGGVDLAALAVSLGTVVLGGLGGLWYFTHMAPDLLSRQPDVGEDDEDRE